MFQKNGCWSNHHGSFAKRILKKKKKGTHALINMSHIINMHTIFNESKTRISHEHDINVDHIECDNGCTLIQVQIVRTRGGSANMGWTTSLTMWNQMNSLEHEGDFLFFPILWCSQNAHPDVNYVSLEAESFLPTIYHGNLGFQWF
jgi:hypothetical protein